MTIKLFLEVLAVVLLAMAAAKLPEPPHAAYGWLGLAILAVVEVVGLR